jgi:hypothetical protein
MLSRQVLDLRATLMTSLCVCFFCLGCGPSAPFQMVPVSGQVRYEDETPIPGAKVRVEFHSARAPLGPKTYPRKGVAECDSHGHFSEVTTWKHADGAIVGPQKIVVLSFDEQQRPTLAVPREYQSPTSTPLNIEVPPYGPPLNLKIRKSPL